MSQGSVHGVPIDTDAALTANSDQLVASQKATKSYVDTHPLAGDATGTLAASVVTRARGLRESGGTTLPMGPASEGQVLKIVGGAVVGAWMSVSVCVAPNPQDYVADEVSVSFPTAFLVVPVGAPS